jgi:hypothetical protein
MLSENYVKRLMIVEGVLAYCETRVACRLFHKYVKPSSETSRRKGRKLILLTCEIPCCVYCLKMATRRGINLLPCQPLSFAILLSRIWKKENLGLSGPGNVMRKNVSHGAFASGCCCLDWAAVTDLVTTVTMLSCKCKKRKEFPEFWLCLGF